MKAFRLNKYESYGEVLKYFGAFELHRDIKNSMSTTVKNLHFYKRALLKTTRVVLDVPKCFLSSQNSHA